MIPQSIEIAVIKEVNNELVEVSQRYFYEFNFNAGNAFRRAEGLDYNEYMAKINDEEDQFEISEGVGKFFYYALQEGQRIVNKEFDLSIEDVLRWVNKEAENYQAVLNEFQETAPPQDENDKKKVEEKA